MATKKQVDPKITIAVLKQMLTLATSGLGLVAALAWNSAIQEAVNVYIKPFFPNGSLISLIIYAVLITIVVVVITINLSRVIGKLEE